MAFLLLYDGGFVERLHFDTEAAPIQIFIQALLSGRVKPKLPRAGAILSED